MSLSAFRRAVGLSQKIGSRNRAAEAALAAAFQEMEERLAVMDQLPSDQTNHFKYDQV